MTIIDPFPIASLPDRYSISKQSVYKRIDALGIPTFKQGRQAFVRADCVKILDDLHEYLATGGLVATFAKSVDIPVEESEGSTEETVAMSPESQLDSSEVSTEVSTSPIVGREYLQRLVVAAERLSTAIEKVSAVSQTPASPSPDPIANLEKLDRAVERGWVLSTSQVRVLTGAKPVGQNWMRGVFGFSRYGRLGREGAWKVYRVDEFNPSTQE